MFEERFLKDIDWIITTGGAQRQHEFDIGRYSSVVPQVLIKIWEKIGVATWADGAFITCDPDAYQSSLAEAFDGYPHLTADELTPFILTAFGKIKAWHGRYGIVDVDLPRGRAIVSRGPNHPVGSNETHLLARFPVDRGAVDDFGFLDAAQQDLGRLGIDEIYGFVPALAFGGSPQRQNLDRLRADVHLSILAQTAPIDVLYIAGTYGHDAHFVRLGD